MVVCLLSSGMSGLDLYLSQRTLALMFVYAAVLGFGLGAVYDGLKILRMVWGERRQAVTSAADIRGQGSFLQKWLLRVLRFVEDVAFMLIAATALLLLAYYTNDGSLRAPAPVGMACGFFVYVHVLSPWVLRLAEILLRWLRCLLWRIFRLVSVPLRGLWRLTVARWMAGLRNSRRTRETERMIALWTESAARGFDIEIQKQEKNRKPPA
jgi:hypothetical protein